MKVTDEQMLSNIFNFVATGRAIPFCGKSHLPEQF
jgi:hypothetical protein